MKKYTETNDTIYDEERMCTIPKDLANMDYVRFLQEVEEGTAEVEVIQTEPFVGM